MIGNDTGPRHLATVFGTPFVTLFGPTDIRWTPPTANEHALQAQPFAPGELIADDRPAAFAIDRIPTGDVLFSVQKILNQSELCRSCSGTLATAERRACSAHCWTNRRGDKIKNGGFTHHSSVCGHGWQTQTWNAPPLDQPMKPLPQVHLRHRHAASRVIPNDANASWGDGFEHVLCHQPCRDSAEERSHGFALRGVCSTRGCIAAGALGSRIRLQSRRRPSCVAWADAVTDRLNQEEPGRGATNQTNDDNNNSKHPPMTTCRGFCHLTAGFGKKEGPAARDVPPSHWGRTVEVREFHPRAGAGTVGPHAVHQVAELSISVEVTRKADPIGFFQSRFHPAQQLTELSTTYPRVILTKQPQTSSPTQSRGRRAKVVFNTPAITVSSKSPKSQRTKPPAPAVPNGAPATQHRGDAPGSEFTKAANAAAVSSASEAERAAAGAPHPGVTQHAVGRGRRTPTASTGVG